MFGSVNGFEGISNSNVVELTYKDVWDLKHAKVNPLGTSRFNPAKNEKDLDIVVER